MCFLFIVLMRGFLRLIVLDSKNKLKITYTSKYREDYSIDLSKTKTTYFKKPILVFFIELPLVYLDRVNIII